MINWLKRRILFHRGLSCGKTRMQTKEADWRDLLDESPIATVAILILGFLAFVRIGAWQNPVAISEVIVLCLMVMAVIYIIVPLTLRNVWCSNQLILLLIGCLCVNLLINKALFLDREKFQLLENPIPGLLVPTAITPMLMSILISPAAGFVTAFLLTLLGSLFLEGGPGLFLSSLLTGFSAAYFTQEIRRRSDLLMAGISVGIVGMICAFFLGGLIKDNFSIKFLLVQGVWAISLGVFTSFIVGAILPILEWLFDRITEISWLELSDLNHPLLKRLQAEAPGSYHHSLNVANLAEAAAAGIEDVNPSQCRVCSYFHDIGKLVKPQYFIENSNPDHNPHDQLSPSMSALIIIAHVKEGVNLALQHELRQPIINVIKEHHGTSLVYYFYHRALQQKEDAIEGGKILKKREEDIPDVDERSFRYPGPIPQSKESAIVCLADAIESSSRTLKNPTAQRVEAHVQDIIAAKVKEGQLDESNLTFNELSIIAQRFTFTLKNMLHARIEYPRIKKEKQRKDPHPQSTKANEESGPQSSEPATAPTS